MRLIDADTLVARCGDYYVEEGPEDGFIGTLKCLVDMQPTIGDWISVKDKLPDDASDVLAYYDDGTESRIIPANYYKGCWYDCVFNRPIDDLEKGFIRHWMSLPEPPEEVKPGC